MGIIFDNTVNEEKIYQAYGLKVYGKINRYEWTLLRNETENALISIRIADENNNDIFIMNMGNNCIFQSELDRTLDNFLWWIVEDKPDNYSIKKQVYKSLCASDSLFNHNIQQRKMKKRQEETEKIRYMELEAMREAREEATKHEIILFCEKNGYIPYFECGRAYIIKPHNTDIEKTLRLALTNNKQMKSLIEIMQRYPENKDARIVKDGSLEDIIKDIA